ncbi:MAG: DUF1569 domain-containing protein [Phycisphaerales bacterium]|nr:DUF1569 domain-containing protein [Phycisphaerales bacterium]
MNTKTANRRTVQFNSIADLEQELEALQSASTAGTLRTTGNWTPGQIFQHCARFWRSAIDGFPADMKPPLWMKWTAQLLLKRMAVRGSPPPPGIKLPPQAEALLPDDSVSFDEGLSELRAQLDRTKAGDQFAAVSPLFGKLTHDQWQRMQLGHCQLHLGFLHPN